MEDGMINVTRRVLPTTVVTELDFVTTAGVPPAANSMVTFVFEGKIVPLGNPEPVMVMLVTPACPAIGVATGDSVTTVWACNGNSLTTAINTAKKQEKRT
jgi:hypothetical protein